MHTRHKDLAIVSADTVLRLIQQDMHGCVRVVRDAYLAHRAGQTINPPSVFLRFPDRPSARIIGLPAHLRGELPVSGLKWIASYPENVRAGLPRASALLILNDAETGCPFACMEGSVISAVRTAASAVLAAASIRAGRKQLQTLGIIGAGVISRYVLRFLLGTGWEIDTINVYDTSPAALHEFESWMDKAGISARVLKATGAEAACSESEMVLFATVAREPHVHEAACFSHLPTVLHLSLRDLAPGLILAADNVVDDVHHVVSAGTSLELAAAVAGGTDFISCELVDLLLGIKTLSPDKPTVFSPFGLGILDLAMGQWIHSRAAQSAQLTMLRNFFPQEDGPWKMQSI